MQSSTTRPLMFSVWKLERTKKRLSRLMHRRGYVHCTILTILNLHNSTNLCNYSHINTYISNNWHATILILLYEREKLCCYFQLCILNNCIGLNNGVEYSSNCRTHQNPDIHNSILKIIQALKFCHHVRRTIYYKAVMQKSGIMLYKRRHHEP